MQSGYGALAVERKRVDAVMKYIRNQEVHHGEATFVEEYREILEGNNVDYDERYIFQPVDE